MNAYPCQCEVEMSPIQRGDLISGIVRAGCGSVPLPASCDDDQDQNQDDKQVHAYFENLISRESALPIEEAVEETEHPQPDQRTYGGPLAVVLVDQVLLVPAALCAELDGFEWPRGEARSFVIPPLDPLARPGYGPEEEGGW
jgi:hypothetical protein